MAIHCSQGLTLGHLWLNKGLKKQNEYLWIIYWPNDHSAELIPCMNLNKLDYGEKLLKR